MKKIMSKKKYIIDGKEVVAWITRGGKRIPIFEEITITDVTPKGYEPLESGKTVTPKLEKLKGETTDQAIARVVGYQIDNGKVKIIETKDGWKAIINDFGDIRTFSAYKKQHVLNQVYKALYPDYLE